MSQRDPITIFITRNVRAGSEQAFEVAMKRWIPQFMEYPGHLGVHVLRPWPGNREYGAVLKFRSEEDWKGFQQSEPYLEFLGEIRQYLETEPQVETTCGLESWFSPMGAHISRVPPRWKMACITWIGVCLTVYVVSVCLSPITTQWPWLLGFITINGGVVVVLTWCVMPILNRLFRGWLLPAGTK